MSAEYLLDSDPTVAALIGRVLGVSVISMTVRRAPTQWRLSRHAIGLVDAVFALGSAVDWAEVALSEFVSKVEPAFGLPLGTMRIELYGAVYRLSGEHPVVVLLEHEKDASESASRLLEGGV